MYLPASDWLFLPVLPPRVKKFKLMLYPAKRFGDCSLSCVKSIQLFLAQPLNIPCGLAELTGNKISHLNSAGIAIPSNQFDFWWTKSPRKVDAFVSEKKEIPNKIDIPSSACSRYDSVQVSDPFCSELRLCQRSMRFSRTNQRNVFDLCFGIWKHEAIFPHAAFFLSHIFLIWALSRRRHCPHENDK